MALFAFVDAKTLCVFAGLGCEAGTVLTCIFPIVGLTSGYHKHSLSCVRALISLAHAKVDPLNESHGKWAVVE